MGNSTERIENLKIVRIANFFPNTGFSVLFVLKGDELIRVVGVCSDLAIFYPDYVGLKRYLLDVEGRWNQKGETSFEKYGPEFIAEK